MALGGNRRNIISDVQPAVPKSVQPDGVVTGQQIVGKVGVTHGLLYHGKARTRHYVYPRMGWYAYTEARCPVMTITAADTWTTATVDGRGLHQSTKSSVAMATDLEIPWLFDSAMDHLEITGVVCTTAARQFELRASTQTLVDAVATTTSNTIALVCGNVVPHGFYWKAYDAARAVKQESFRLLIESPTMPASNRVGIIIQGKTQSGPWELSDDPMFPVFVKMLRVREIIAEGGS